ncbi:hypothetical protein [Kaistia terrae]|uniref:ZZ-type domain-containing protein n=1 Tax=Kaistia terrae TaxID=537017 RepID=A0ABW0Q283_9HYPH|nr:hypothetical protein [Kaistia terrae]MCX5581471.1 hypothetical protein [Kaistia terrae]
MAEQEWQPHSRCEGCDKPIWSTDAYLSCEDCDLCAGCAPTYADMAADPAAFAHPTTGKPLTVKEVRSIIDRHISAGGSPNDSLATKNEGSLAPMPTMSEQELLDGLTATGAIPHTPA